MDKQIVKKESRINLSREEMETHLNMTGDDHGTWSVYSDDPVMQRKIEAVGGTLVKTSADGIGKHCTLRANQISFRKGEKRELSEAQIANIEKLKASRGNTLGYVAKDEKRAL